MVCPLATLSDTTTYKFARFALPDIPRDWKPDPRRVWALDTKPEDKENVPDSKASQDTKKHGP